MFTDKALAKLAPKAAPYKVFEGASVPGFCLVVSPGGTKTFYQRVREGGKDSLKRLGSYPDLSIREARARAADVREMPGKASKTAATGTVNELANVYYARLESRSRRSIAQAKRYIDKDLIPWLGDQPANSVTAEHIRDLIYRLIARGAHVGANRFRATLSAMFQAGIHHDNDPKSVGSTLRFAIQANPVANVPRDPTVERAGERALTWDELRQVMTDNRLPAAARQAVILILATGGQRPGEVLGASLDEFNLIDPHASTWTIPGSRTKNKREHLIPLTDFARHALGAVIKEELGTPGRWLFPDRRVFCALRPWPVAALSVAVKRYCEATGMQSWTPRDLRRTVKTRMGELGVSKDIRDRLQNHALTDVSSRHYDKYSYIPEKRAALDLWCGKLRKLVDPVA